MSPLRPFFASIRAGLSLRTRVGILLAVSFSVFAASFLYVSLSSRAADLRQELAENGQASLALIERSVAEQPLTACADRPDVDSVTFRDARGRTLTAPSPIERDTVPAWLTRLFSPLK